MEPESSLPHSQVPATCPYPKPIIISCFRRFSDYGVPVVVVSRKLIYYEQLSKGAARPTPNMEGHGTSLCPVPRSENVWHG